MKIILNNSQSAGKIAIKDAAMIAPLGGIGVSVDAGAKVAYAASDADLAAFKGKLIICPRMEMLSKGGALAIVEEGGKPAIYLNMPNVTASGVAVSEVILKIGKVAK